MPQLAHVWNISQWLSGISNTSTKPHSGQVKFVRVTISTSIIISLLGDALRALAYQTADALLAVHIVNGKGAAQTMQFTQFRFHALQFHAALTLRTQLAQRFNHQVMNIIGHLRL